MDEKANFDLQDFLPYLLNQAAESASLGFQSIYKSRYGMMRAEWRVLFHLGQFGRLTAGDICDRARMHKTKISRAVQKLAEKRYLTRERSEEDRRHEFLDLTDQGRQVYQDLMKVAAEYDARLVALLGEEDAAALRRTLHRLAEEPRD